MGLIKEILTKTAGVGLIIADAPLGPVALGATVPVFTKMREMQDDIKYVNNHSKLVCALNNKLAKELEQLNSTTFDMGDYVVSSDLEEDKQQKYEQMFDKVINSFGELPTVKIISKQEFVDYMMRNGDTIERYLNSEKFYSTLKSLEKILKDETKTPEEKLYKLKQAIKNDTVVFDDQFWTCRDVENAMVWLMIFELFNVIVDAFSLACLDEFESLLQVIIHFLLGMISEMGYLLIAEEF